MNFTFEHLKFLAHTGTPLDLRIKQLGHTSFLVTEKDRGEFTFNHYIHPGVDSFDNKLRHAFRHYPSPVTIDGEDVRRFPFPNLSRVSIITADQNIQAHARVGNHNIGDNPETDEDVNLFAGGILSRLLGTQAVRRNHMASTPGKYEHWNPAMMVVLSPIQVITDEEFQEMTEAEFKDLTQENPQTTLGKAMTKRDLKQIRRTLVHPDMPARHKGPVYAHLATRPGYSEDGLGRGGPIIIQKGEPVVFHEGFNYEPETLAVAEALYRTDTGFVPVSPGRADVPESPRVIRSFEFQVIPPGTGNQQDMLRAVQEINLTFQVEGEPRTHQIQAPFHFLGESPDSIRVNYIPQKTQPEELAALMVRAHWEFSHYEHGENYEKKVEEITRTVKKLFKSS